MNDRVSHGSIYLDHAATSWPKAPGVIDAVARLYDEPAGNPGRSAHGPAGRALDVVRQTRAALARLIGAGEVDRVVLTPGCTDALNIAIHATIHALSRAGAGGVGAGLPLPNVVAAQCEHNAVLRPLAWHERRRQVELRTAPIDARTFVDPERVASLVDERTALVCVQHAGNVTGAVQPIREIVRAVRGRSDEALVLVDAAQSAGAIPIDVAALGADLLAFGCHKSLGGLPGLGVLYVGPRAWPDPSGHTGPPARLDSARAGGTGDSRSREMPERLPAALEPGTPNTASCAAALEALRHLERAGAGDPNAAIRSYRAQIAELTSMFMEAVADMPGLHAPGPPAEQRLGVVTVYAPGHDPTELAAMLDSAFGIAARAGLHCAPGVHAACAEHLGESSIADVGGLRFSIGHQTSAHDVQQAIDALRAVLAPVA